MEQKFLDTSSPGNGVSSSGTILGPFNAVPQGTTQNSHIGDHLRMRRFDFRTNHVAGDATNFMRMIVFQWFQNTALQSPTPTILLQNLGANVASSINETNQDSPIFRIITDRTFSLSTGGSNQAVVRNFSIYGKRIPRKQQQFNNNLTTGFNQIYMMLISDSITAPNPTSNVYCRFTFTDA